MKRHLAFVAVLALVLAACSGSDSSAAVVNGSEITEEEVRSLVFAGEDLPDSEFTRLLDLAIQWTAVADAAEAGFGIDPTADEIAAEVDRVFSLQGAGLTREEFLEAQNISEAGLDKYAAQLLIGEQVLAQLEADIPVATTEEANQLLLDDPAAWTEVCSAHILVATEEEASAVLERLDGGEDFAAIAIELSLDTGSGAAGGDLGCASPSGYVDEFAAATLTANVGEVYGPVETQFGFHLIRVDSRSEATTDELIESLADIRLAEAVDEWYRSSLASADITVAEQWGTWVAEPTPGIVAPVG
ncbi:MAG: peptidylprolyl isomerase [Acidimicrobiia bacterium]|nr:peptidylprolyl isomerase [Acidimicrobiia bacterium]